MARKVKSDFVTIRIEPEFKAQLEKKADDAGMFLSEYLRASLIATEVIGRVVDGKVVIDSNPEGE